MGRIEADVTERVERLLAKAGLVHGDEPLARGTEDDRLLAAPAVRIGVRDVLMKDEGATLLEPLDDLRVGSVHVHAGPGAACAHAVALVEVAVVVDRHHDRDVEAHAGIVVVDAVPGSGVDDAGAIFERDVVSIDELALDALVAEDRLLVLVVAELGARHLPDRAVSGAGKLVVAVAELLAVLLDERLCHELAASVNDDADVLGFRMEDHGVIGRKGPGRRRPDVDPEISLVGLESLRHCRHLEAHEDCRRHLVAVLDLRLGESRMAVHAPVHRLPATVDGALVEDGLEDLDVGRIVVMRVGQIRICPLAEDAEALEALALRVDLLDSHLVADLADLDGRELVELLRAELLLDLVLNRLAVAVPARNIRRLVAAHGPVAVDDVLRDLVLCMSQMDRAVCIRRSVMQHELLVAFVLLEKQAVHIVLLPLLETLGLMLCKACTHGEPGLRQVHRLLELVSHLETLAFRKALGLSLPKDALHK